MNLKIFILFTCGFRMVISGFRQCSSLCLNDKCDGTTGACDACADNFYGNYCAHDCKRCKDEQCDRLQCINGCKNGYYQVQGQNDSECLPCLPNCFSCLKSHECIKCNDGYFFQVHGDVHSCEKCRWNCASCSSTNDCISCEPGYYGNYCGYKCSVVLPNCSLCKGSNAHNVICIQCSNGRVLRDDKCETDVSHTTCPSICLSCTTHNVCESCKDGWYGMRCKQTCSNDIGRCAKCKETNGLLTCTACIDRHILSNNTCVSADRQPVTTTSSMTDSTPSQTRSVQQVTSTTLSDQLVTSTPKTVDSTKYHTKSVLDSNTINNNKPSLNPQTDNSSIVIGALGGGGGLILIVVIVLIVCFVTRRRTKARDVNDEQEVAGNGQVHEEDSSDYAVYAKPNKVKKVQQTEDYIYATPIKDKKADNEKKVSIKETHKAPLTFCNEAFIEETNLDGIQLETLEGELTSEIEMGTNTSTSDTYYNVDGLLRSRIQIPDLLEYVKKKKDFDAEFKKLPKGLQRSCNEALNVNNRKKNRFNGIYAYDATRVELENNAYINANYIDGHNQTNAYIASLGPTSDTMNKFSTFWGMIWQENVEVVVMLTNLEEGGKMKCEQYWPNPGSTKSCNEYIIKCAHENIFSEFVVRDLILEKKGVSKSRSIKHYHYTAWPDRYVPDTVASLVEFRDKVERTERKGESPIVVHCSAGIGRTGTYIALDLLIKEGKDCGYVDIFGCALGLRGQRVNLIQNEEQYEYLHHAVLYSLTCDTEPLSITVMKEQMTDKRISKQFKPVPRPYSYRDCMLSSSFLNVKMRWADFGFWNGAWCNSVKAMEALAIPSKRLLVWTANYSERKENRMGADVPSDSYRVRLQSSKNDYINAVYINGYLRRNAYITAQTPLPSTVEGFLSMVYHERCSCIVSLDEEDVAKESIGQYVPNANERSTFGNYQIQCNGINNCDGFIISRISISKSPSENMDILHFQVSNWKSNEDVPSHTKSFLNLVKEVTETVHTQHTSGPILLQCLTGSQRCGIFCAVSIMLEQLAVDKYMSGAHIVSHIRRRRSTALQNQKMLKFCYHCVADSLHSVSNKDHYYNTSGVKH